MSKLFERIWDAKVSRRDFLKVTAAATAAVAGLSLAGCQKTELGTSEPETSRADVETSGTEVPVEHDPVVDVEGKGEWLPAACWNNCGGRCLNKALVVDGVVVRQKTDDTHPDDLNGSGKNHTDKLGWTSFQKYGAAFGEFFDISVQAGQHFSYISRINSLKQRALR